MHPTMPKPTKGYEISAFEVKAFLFALGLDPAEVVDLRIADRRVIATVADEKVGLASSRCIVIPIVTPRR